MEEKPWTKYWIARFKSDSQFGHMRLKRLNVGYPPFDIDEDLVDWVDLEEFIRIEENRLPLFIGSQFGIHPNLNELPNFYNGEKLIAILGMSLLSGCVAGLSIYRLNESDYGFSGNRRKLFKTFRNENILNAEIICRIKSKGVVNSPEQLNVPVKPALAIKVKNELLNLMREDSQVIVICSFKSDSEFNRIRIWKSTYLFANDSDHKSKLLYSENIAIYPDWMIVREGITVKFVLVFSGLPKNCKYFDLIEVIPEPDGFEIKNIKRNKSDVYRISI